MVQTPPDTQTHTHTGTRTRTGRGRDRHATIGVQFWCVRNGRLHFSSWCCCFSFFRLGKGIFTDLRWSSSASACACAHMCLLSVCPSSSPFPPLSCFLSQSESCMCVFVCVIMVSILSTACLQQVDADPGPGPLNVAWGNEPANLATQWTVRDVLVVARGACIFLDSVKCHRHTLTEKKCAKQKIDQFLL